jgi:hypothetical protein
MIIPYSLVDVMCQGLLISVYCNALFAVIVLFHI